MKKTITLLAAVTVITGCSTVQSHTQPVKLICPEPETVVLVNGKKTPCPSTVDLPRNRKSIIEAYKQGYAPVTRDVDCHFGLWGKLDVAGTLIWLAPIVGTWTPGAWDLDVDEVELALIQKL